MACPVCFTDADPAITQSLNAGIFVLLGATALVLAGLVRFIVRLVRLAGRPAEAGHYDRNDSDDAVRADAARSVRLHADLP